MTATADFFVEIGTEELPPKALKKLANAFSDGIKNGLRDNGLGGADAAVYATPRRLAVHISNVITAQTDRVEEKRGPALQAAFKEDGTPTPAVLGFAKSCGTTVDALEKLQTDKGAWLVFRKAVKGQRASELLPAIVNKSLDSLPIPKRMRWGWNDHAFVRPVHWVVMLLGNEIVPCEIMGHKAGRETRGHRFHCNRNITLPNPNSYRNLLETEGHVIADFEQRKSTIRAEVEEAGVKLGGQAQIEEALLEEVTGLVEWPMAVTGKFDDRFLEVPPEALISAMKGHQKYFHVLDKQGNLLPNFITISNIESSRVESVKNGNERVIRPRLTDADFFWRQDKKQPLSHNLQKLAHVVFQNKLGTVFDKVARVDQLAQLIAERIDGNKMNASRAAQLCKCDLMSAMVNEFPELQGVMGQYYALNDNENADVAVAIKEHYLPRFAGDITASTKTGQAVAIADKIDTITAIFSINEQPSGDKDPFGLRRASLGVLRTIVENKLDIDIVWLVKQSLEILTKQGKKAAEASAIVEFLFERLRSYYADQKIAYDSFEAVLSVLPNEPHDFHLRLLAVEEFRSLPQAASLSAANKRIRNILKKSDTDFSGTVSDNLLSQDEERSLYKTLLKTEDKAREHFDRRDYTKSLKELAALKDDVDSFFDKVMVNVDDKALRNNRLALLGRLNKALNQIADISKLQNAE